MYEFGLKLWETDLVYMSTLVFKIFKIVYLHFKNCHVCFMNTYIYLGC
jgi:hypothetical protein